MTSVLVGSDETVASPTFLVGETPTDTAAPPTAAVVRDDGTVLAAPTVSQATAGDGIYNAALTAAVHTTRVDRLALTWLGTISGAQQTLKQTVDVIGAHYVGLDELRLLDGLGDPLRFSTDALRVARDQFADVAERYCGVAFVPRYASDLLIGGEVTSLVLEHRQPTSIIAVATIHPDGTETAYTVTGWYLDPAGILTGAAPFGRGSRVRVRYVHGYAVPPADIVAAAKDYCRAKLLEADSRYGRDVLSQTTEGVTMRYSTPDWREGRPTGLLDVDRVLNGYRVPVVR